MPERWKPKILGPPDPAWTSSRQKVAFQCKAFNIAENSSGAVDRLPLEWFCLVPEFSVGLTKAFRYG